MKADDVIGLMIVSFLAGSVATMILFTALDGHLNKKSNRKDEG